MKRVISIFITLAVICSLLSGAVCTEADSAAGFKDVRDSDWFAEAVEKLTLLKIIDGLPGGSFNPKEEVTRAQFVKMLVQAMEYKKTDSVSFEDLKPFKSSKPHWACVYIETALRNSVIVKDETGDNFYPDVPLKRADMGMMMIRALKLTPSEGDNPFSDLMESNGYLTKLYEEYLIRGTIEGGKVLYKPEGLTTRAEAAVIISRMVEYKEDPEGFVAKAAMEERFANGTQTAKDIAAKRAIEIEKAKADPNYIMEPIITVEYNTDPWEYRYFYLYYENEADYSDDTNWELECVNYKQLNTYEMPRPDGTFVKNTITGWRPLGSRFKDTPRLYSYSLGKTYYTTQDQINDFKIYAGMTIEFKITVMKGLNRKVVYKTIVVKDIKFKG
ncbi:MAG TPA: S-layer homology domain-containing protein [Clostridia bacterium]|nr:S-layer homology domain-containing protein [Clostridia bacterium]